MGEELKTSLKKWGLILLAFAGLGLLCSHLRRAAGDDHFAQHTRSAIRNTAGKGVLFGVLGGYRSLISDLVWIKSYVLWERRDLAGCLAAMDLAVSLDPQMVMYWRMGSYVIAYNTPHWIMDKMRAEGREVTPEFEDMLRRRQTRFALAFLDRGLEALPDNRALIIEKAQIYLNRLDDYASALAEYEKLMRLDADPPVFVRRFYAECLIRTGRPAEALKVLEDLKKILYKDEPLYPVVTEQIGQLKRVLEKTK